MANIPLYELAPADASHRRAVLQGLLWIIIVFGVLFQSLNFARGNYVVAIMELVMMLYAVVLLVIVRRTVHLRRWSLAYLIPFFSALLVACGAPASSSAIFIWVLVIPVLAYLLLGRRLGFAFTTFYLTAAGLIFIWKLATGAGPYPPVAIADVVLCAISIFALSHIYESIRERTDASLRELAVRDPLTGLPNRAQFSTIFEREYGEFERYATPACVLLIDLDNFKQINDSYGHEAGDEVLCSTAGVFTDRLRETDLACRMGGDEFAIILTNTSRDEAAQVAEILREAVADKTCPYQDEDINLTATIGIAELGDDGHDLKTLLSCADRRLYEGKREDRNRVVAA